MKAFKLESKTNTFKLTLTEFDDIYKEIALVGYYSNYLTPNITKYNNVLPYNGKRLIQEGLYSLDELQEAIRKTGCTTTFDRNKTLNRIETTILNMDLNFGCENSIGNVLGFENLKLEKGQKYIAINPPNISSFNTINVYCEFVSGMVKSSNEFGNMESNLIATFKPKVYFREDIIYEPSYPLFFKTNWIKTNKIIKIEVKDENDKLIDLAGAFTTIILLLK